MEGKGAKAEIMRNTHGMPTIFQVLLKDFTAIGLSEKSGRIFLFHCVNALTFLTTQYLLLEPSRSWVKCTLLPTFYKRLTRLTRVVELPRVRDSK